MDGQPEDLWLIDRLLAGDADAESAALSALLAAAAAPGFPDELAGEEAAVAAFRAVSSGISSPSSRTRARRIPMVSPLLAGKLAMATAAAAAGIAIAGTAAAAYTGALPDGIQDLAHHTIGAPAPSPTASSSQEHSNGPRSVPSGRATSAATAGGPDATGAAAFGLCTAYQHGGVATTSVAYQSLVKAAGEASRIDTFCASAAHHGQAPAGHAPGAPTSDPTGRPTGAPAGHPTGRPSSRPTHHPTGAPASRPTMSTGR